MNAASGYAATERPLESLGISAPEEFAYVALLDHPEATLAELSSELAWPTRKETVMTGVMVLIMATLLGVFFLGVDSFFDAVVRFLLSLAQ